jgi:predicted AAA+ superfamily ATPase
MFKRDILIELQKWATKNNRKPLIIRGARQVGKTSVVQQFAECFGQYLYLNLELKPDRRPFEQFTTMDTLLETLFFLKNLRYSEKENTLIFIDEIQECPEALNILRYFYEQVPKIHIIAAGSLLETLFNNQINFPVGRVEFLVVRPVSFSEFLGAIGENSALEQLKHIPFNHFAHQKLLDLYHTYALIGGMPEIVKSYAENRDLTALSPIYDSLLTTYMDDVEKYCKSEGQIQLLRHAIRAGFTEAGKRIKFQGFGKSNYGSREMGEALRTLEKTMLFSLIYPVSSTRLPLLPDLKKSPRLQVFDTGIMNYSLGLQKEMIGTNDLSTIYQGTLIEHLTGQEIVANQFLAMNRLDFWVREKKTSVAELDFLYVWEGKLIPVEVKSGKEGTLRSLHLFMDEAPHSIAVRLYAGALNITSITTQKGKQYSLLNLPYFLASRLVHYLNWMNV